MVLQMAERKMNYFREHIFGFFICFVLAVVIAVLWRV